MSKQSEKDPEPRGGAVRTWRLEGTCPPRAMEVAEDCELTASERLERCSLPVSDAWGRATAFAAVLRQIN